MYKTQADAVKDFLCAYRAEEEHIDNELNEIRELKSRIMSIGAQEITDMPRAPLTIKDELAEYVIRLETLESRLSESMRKHERDRHAILELVGKLKRADEREIMKSRYLFAMEWSDVLNRVYHEEEDFGAKQEAYRRKMYRAHEDALNEFGRLWSVK